MSAVPPWRRLDPRGPAARALAFALVAMLAAGTAMVALGPLVARREAAERALAETHARAAALERAAAALAAREGGPAPDALAAARGWLETVAPARAADAATLALLSRLRATAEKTGVTLTALAPVRAETAELQPLTPPLGLGLALVAAEARLSADHEGLAAFLEALGEAEGARVVALDLSAATAAPLAEAGRLTARVLAVALARAPEG